MSEQDLRNSGFLRKVLQKRSSELTVAERAQVSRLRARLKSIQEANTADRPAAGELGPLASTAVVPLSAAAPVESERERTAASDGTVLEWGATRTAPLEVPLLVVAESSGASESTPAESFGDVTQSARRSNANDESERSNGETTLEFGCTEQLQEWLDTSIDSRDCQKLPLAFFTGVVLRILGSELEGREIGLGLAVVADSSRALPFTLRQLMLNDRERAALEAGGRVAAAVIRKHVVGRADGTLGLEMAVMEPCHADRLRLGLPTLQVHPPDADKMYKLLTQYPDCRTALWLKPSCSARIYSQGQFVAQVIKVRDGLGWSIRKIPDLVRAAATLVQDRTGSFVDPSVFEYILELLCDVSESRLGASAYFVRSEDELLALTEPGAGRAPVIQRFEDPGLANSPVRMLPRQRVLQVLTDDGGTVFAADGRVLANRAYFNGGGGRRAIAQEVCAPTRALSLAAIVVSQDGPMYLAGGDDDESFAEVDRTRYL